MTERRTIDVSGMSCEGCERNVEDGLAELEGVSRVEADNESGTVEVVLEDEVADDDLAMAVRDAGYEVVA